MNRKIFCLFFWLMLSAGMTALAQQPAQQGQEQNNDKVIEIEAQILDARVELPQVQILDKRKKSNFDEVKVEKSFKSELSGKTEELKFTPNTSGKIKPIKNIDVLLNKKRF
jgi:TolA-binding protein